MTATILVTGARRRASLGLAAALGAEAAALTSAPTLLLELGEGAQRRGTTLLAAPGARRVEEALRAGGLRGSARGHLCHLALPEPSAEMSELADLPAASQAEIAVVHLPGRLWMPALERGGADLVGGCLLVSLPADRSLAALAVGELRRRGLPAQVATAPPSPLAFRRALAGVRAGGALSERVAAIARRLLGLRTRSGQALPALLGAGLILILAALALAAIGGAATGRGRVQRAADLAALSAARSMRDDVSRLLAPARLSDGAPNPRHLSRAQYLARARLAAVDAARRNEVDPARLRIDFPDAASQSAAAREGRGGGRGRSGTAARRGPPGKPAPDQGRRLRRRGGIRRGLLVDRDAGASGRRRLLGAAHLPRRRANRSLLFVQSSYSRSPVASRGLRQSATPLRQGLRPLLDTVPVLRVSTGDTVGRRT